MWRGSKGVIQKSMHSPPVDWDTTIVFGRSLPAVRLSQSALHPTRYSRSRTHTTEPPPPRRGGSLGVGQQRHGFRSVASSQYTHHDISIAELLSSLPNPFITGVASPSSSVQVCGLISSTSSQICFYIIANGTSHHSSPPPPPLPLPQLSHSLTRSLTTTTTLPKASPLLCRMEFQPQRCNPGLTRTHTNHTRGRERGAQNQKQQQQDKNSMRQQGGISGRSTAILLFSNCARLQCD